MTNAVRDNRFVKFVFRAKLSFLARKSFLIDICDYRCKLTRNRDNLDARNNRGGRLT